ncbi:hypothetical protein BIWAKO_05034 [Bosea sp. BIWAKO-01]|nr:hypothetical protein BIWAKO_05034 [Bosea sp. BIWAKO-01]
MPRSQGERLRTAAAPNTLQTVPSTVVTAINPTVAIAPRAMGSEAWLSQSKLRL